jgi:LPXTG-motif cell wall-anchored protein
MLIGILGFFTFMAFVAAVVPIVRGEPSATASLVLLGCVVLLGGAIVLRRRS